MIINNTSAFKDTLSRLDKVYLYGAGDFSRRLLTLMKDANAEAKIQEIFVTNTVKQPLMHGIRVTRFGDHEINNEIPIILAVSAQYQQEIKEHLHSFGASNILAFGDFFEEDLNSQVFLIRDRARLEESKINRKKIINKIRRVRDEIPSDVDILLLSPPYWDVHSPFSAVPCLMAKLIQEGFNPVQMDLGILFYNRMLRKEWKSTADLYLKERFFQRRVKKYDKNPYPTYQEYKNDMWFFQTSDFDREKIKAEYHNMNNVQRSVLEGVYTDVYYRNIVPFEFESGIKIEDRLSEIVFADFLELLSSDEILDRLANLPTVVGLSITSTHQFLFGCFLAKIIKEAAPDVKIVFGGSCADLFAKSIYPTKSDIQKYFDYVILGEGETSLTMLLKYIKGDGALEDVPNLMQFRDDGSVYFTKQILENVDELPPPNYDGLPLDKYLTPEPVLAYQGSRGCHYGCCAFCNHDAKYRHNYRPKNAVKIVEDLLYLTKRYHTKYIQFVDEAIRPDCFAQMVEEMDKHPEFKEIKWFYYSRVSMKYTEELLKKAKINGCEMVMFGIETFNQRLLNFIKKGITADASEYCLELFHRCGIKTYAFFMYNLPSESLEETKEDYYKLKGLRHCIDMIGLSEFTLVPNTDMYTAPEKFNITRIDPIDPTRFDSHHDGTPIDKDELQLWGRNAFAELKNEWGMSADRYVVFFETD